MPKQLLFICILILSCLPTPANASALVVDGRFEYASAAHSASYLAAPVSKT